MPAPGAIVRVVALAESQDGVISREQLLRCGVGRGAIRHWLAAGRLHPLYPAVYAVGYRSAEIRRRLSAALLYAGGNSGLSHQTGAWWWTVLDAEPRHLHLTTPARRRSLKGLCIHERRTVPLTEHRGLPVTTVAQTLLDLAATMSFAAVRAAVAEADHQELLVPVEVEGLLGRGRPGSTMMRRALDLHLPELARAQSELERRFLYVVQAAGLPMPEAGVKVAGLTVDCLWRAAGLVVELDGHRSHAYPAAAERDRHRDMTLRAAGLTVLRYTWYQVTREADTVVAELTPLVVV